MHKCYELHKSPITIGVGGGGLLDLSSELWDGFEQIRHETMISD